MDQPRQKVHLGHMLIVHCNYLVSAQGGTYFHGLFLSFLRKSFISPDVLSELDSRGRQQSPNHCPDFSFCIHFLPPLPLPPTNRPDTPCTSHLAASKQSIAPQCSTNKRSTLLAGAPCTHLLTHPPSFIFYSKA